MESVCNKGQVMRFSYQKSRAHNDCNIYPGEKNSHEKVPLRSVEVLTAHGTTTGNIDGPPIVMLLHVSNRIKARMQDTDGGLLNKESRSLAQVTNLNQFSTVEPTH